MEHTIWTEKYRPKTFADVSGQEEVVKRLKTFVEKKNMLNVLFAGPPGVGKSTLALVIARELFGDSWKQNFLELNASDERGIDIVRNNIKEFARAKGFSDAPKIIFLDEADALTREAQQALRRTMENYTHTTRFILSCVTPETTILLPEEREITIGNFLERFESRQEQHVSNIPKQKNTVKDELVLAGVSLSPHTIGKRVLEITTMTGRKIKVTDDHKLLTTQGWVEAGELTKDHTVLVHPHTEGTSVEDDNRKIIDLEKFIEFLSSTEERDGCEKIRQGMAYRKLMTKEKQKILNRIHELRKLIHKGSGLTEREYSVYSIVKENPHITREAVQRTIHLTRMRTVQLLKSIEEKGHIKRHVDKKTHSFSSTCTTPLLLRNDMHIKKHIEKEFGITISYSAVQRSSVEKERGRVDRVLGELKRKELLDTTYNDIKKIGALARLCGFLLGDGHLVSNDIRLCFSGNKEALKKVQRDLDILKYQNYSHITSHTIRNEIRGRKIVGTSTDFHVDSKAFSLLLQFLGIPKGDKVITTYSVPQFVKEGTMFVKREFLKGLFGADADSPRYKGMNFEALALQQNKASILRKNMKVFYKEIAELLETFGVENYVKIRNKGEIRQKDLEPTLTFSLIIRPTGENQLRFFARIGYAYEQHKIQQAQYAAEYLRHKQFIIETQKKKTQVALQLMNGGKTITESARETGVSTDYIRHQQKGKGTHLPRKRFYSFDTWKEQHVHNNTLVRNTIHDIKECGAARVMDITCHKDHNFITNGFVSHNCNYSSKIIDPIQSRCAVFRFKPLPKEVMQKIVADIAKNENLTVDEKATQALIDVSQGDVRRLENILQAAAAADSTLTEDSVFNTASYAKPKEVKEMLEYATKKDFLKAKDLLLKIMLDYGLSGLDVIKQVQQEAWTLSIEDTEKLEIIKKCGEAEFRMIEGADEFVQLEAFLASI